MSDSLIQIKSFLGKYYSEILQGVLHDKYRSASLEKFFEQRFAIQNNKTQMVIDPSMNGLSIIVSGNEIFISKELYDHPSVVVINSIENAETQLTNPKSLYNPEIFQTIAYLICQNHTTLQVVGEIEEPIYIKYRTDFETFYSSVLTFEITNEVDLEVVEEIESQSALNSVINYILNPLSKLKINTVYNNNISGISFIYRNVFARENTQYSHNVLGKGTTQIIDESKIRCSSGSNVELFGLIYAKDKNFHSIVCVEPLSAEYSVTIDYKDIIHGNSNVSFYPVLVGDVSTDSASIEVSQIKLDEIPQQNWNKEISNFIMPIMDRAILERMIGVKRFYDNKAKFLQNL